LWHTSCPFRQALCNGRTRSESDEGELAPSMTCEHVAWIVDMQTAETGPLYVVVEHLEGLDLRQRVARAGRLPVPEAVEYVLLACEALAEAEVAGVVHGNVKPSNLFLTTRADGSPCVKILDLVNVKVVPDGGAQDHALTQTTGVIGSPVYMAPEQIRSPKDV